MEPQFELDKQPRLKYLKVENYRVLKFMELSLLPTLTVLLGPNGSGKSTVFDVFTFLWECFSFGLRRAWDKRERFREMRKPLSLIGIEEPENHLHPQLLPELCEECRNATTQTQLIVTTHSAFFINGLRPEELWVLYRDEQGFTQLRCAQDMVGIK